MAPDARLALVPTAARPQQTQRINRKISQLATKQPHRDIQRVFQLAIRLAEEAIFAGTAMQQMPGIDQTSVEPVLTFWRTVRNQNELAASACSGQNETLAAALITFAVLQTTTNIHAEGESL
jgi:hypothetical protein